MDTVAERLKYARDVRGMSQPALARAVTQAGTRITYQSIQAIEEGGGSKHLNAIARALSVRPEWLELGQEPMDLDAPAGPTHRSPDEEKWRQAVIDAEEFMTTRRQALSPDGKADLVVLFHRLALQKKAGEKLDVAQYHNIIDFALARR